MISCPFAIFRLRASSEADYEYLLDSCLRPELFTYFFVIIAPVFHRIQDWTHGLAQLT